MAASFLAHQQPLLGGQWSFAGVGGGFCLDWIGGLAAMGRSYTSQAVDRVTVAAYDARRFCFAPSERDCPMRSK